MLSWQRRAERLQAPFGFCEATLGALIVTENTVDPCKLQGDLPGESPDAFRDQELPRVREAVMQGQNLGTSTLQGGEGAPSPLEEDVGPQRQGTLVSLEPANGVPCPLGQGLCFPLSPRKTAGKGGARQHLGHA